MKATKPWVVEYDGSTFEVVRQGAKGRVRVYLRTRQGPLRRVRSKALAKAVVDELARRLSKTPGLEL